MRKCLMAMISLTRKMMLSMPIKENMQIPSVDSMGPTNIHTKQCAGLACICFCLCFSYGFHGHQLHKTASLASKFTRFEPARLFSLEWGGMKQEVRMKQKKYENREQMIKQLVKTFKEIPLEMIRESIKNFMPRIYELFM